MDEIIKTVGAIVTYGGGSVAVAYATFKWLSVKWIEDRFAKQLVSLQHEQNKVIAVMRVEIESALNGALKMQEREFIVLPQLWALLLKSYSAARSYTYPVEMVPDVQQMDAEAFEEFLADLDWNESAKRAVRQASGTKRDEVYLKIRAQYKIKLVRADWFKANLYIKEQAILLPQELTERFEVMQELLWKLINSRELGVEIRDLQMQHAAYTEFNRDVEPQIKEVELAIKSRLESHKGNGISGATAL